MKDRGVRDDGGRVVALAVIPLPSWWRRLWVVLEDGAVAFPVKLEGK